MPRRPKDRSEYEGYDPIVTSPEPIERSEEEGYDPIVTMPRQDYKGFQMPSGMSLPQRRKWKRSIDVRESGAGKRQEARDDADTEALKQGIIDRTKDVGGAIKGAAEGVGDVIKAPFEYRAALATDPAGTMAATKEFGSRVMSGDPEARRQAAEGVSMSTVEPFATAADAELARQDLAKGDYAGAAISGASVLLPFVSAGWLKTAMRKGDVPSEAAEKVAELERRVDAGEVTDDMQIRRELAGIEDAHASDYQASLADVESDFDFESVSGKPPGGVGRDVSPSIRALDTKGQADEMQRELDSLSYAGQMESEGRVYMDEDLGEHFANRYSDEVHAEVARRIKAGDKYGSETFYEIADPEDYLPSGGGKPPGGGSEGPSEAEIQAMVDQRFSDPNELEMMKEDMRRLAQAKQEGDIARSKSRSKRTPSQGGPLAQPEGGTRATSRGPRRERPKKKD